MNTLLRILTTPKCWMRNEPTSKEWDAKLNAMLDNPVFTDISQHLVTLNGVVIWVANYPYSFGHPYPDTNKIPKCFRSTDLLPTRKTAFRLHDAIQAHLKATNLL